MKEIWKDVKNYDGRYSVSSLGKVKSFCKSIDGRLLKPSLNSCGYPFVVLCKNNKQKTIKVHRLVAEQFLKSSYFDGAEVNHINGDKTNNVLSNLEWCTSSQNALHAYKTGLRRPAWLGKKGKLHTRSRAVNMFSLQGIFIRRFTSQKEALESCGVSIKSKGISQVCKGARSDAYGYKWEYARVKE